MPKPPIDNLGAIKRGVSHSRPYDPDASHTPLWPVKYYVPMIDCTSITPFVVRRWLKSYVGNVSEISFPAYGKQFSHAINVLELAQAYLDAMEKLEDLKDGQDINQENVP